MVYLRFTRRWFRRRNEASFREHVLPRWGGLPIVYLEVGIFEGMSLAWMLQNVLTHPESRAVGIDPWLMTAKLDSDCMEAVRERAESNLASWTEEGRCRLIRANSAEVLRAMRRRGGFAGVRRSSVDVMMIDGDHNQLAVLDDARNGFSLLKVGGWMLFDDVQNDKTKTGHVFDGLSAFKSETPSLKLVWSSRYVEAYEKLGEPS